MATLISQIIQDAYREANIIAVETSPTDNQNTEALRLLNRYISALYGNEMGDPLTPIPYGANNIEQRPLDLYYWDSVLAYFIPADARLMANLEAAKTLNLHPKPEDGQRLAISDVSGNFATYNLTLNGNGRTIGGSTSIVLSTNGQDIEYFYRGDLGDWKQVSNLILTDTSPFPEEFDDMLIIGLAMRLAPRYGSTTAAESLQTYGKMMKKFSARYGQTRQVKPELALSRLTGNRNYLTFGYDDDTFERGLNLGQ